jgi:DNA mismatch repair protein MutS
MTSAKASPIPEGATPAMAQWFALKAENPDALLFFRMGDFYEMFFADADAASAALDIALTHRGEHAGQPIQMCGVPVHAADAYLARLIRRGFRVAVGEQMEDPKLRVGKAPIRRAVVRLVTPGTLTEESLLDSARPNLLAGLVVAGGPGGAHVGAAWLDISTGLFETQIVALAAVPSLLGRLDPAEILAHGDVDLGEHTGRRTPDAIVVAPAQARKRLAEAFAAASLDAFGSFSDAEAQAAAMLLDYVRLTQAGQMPRLSRPQPQGNAGRLELDAATRASLEIARARDGSVVHTLLGSVQRTLTAAGARLLGEYIAAPLTDVAAIADRQDGWSWMLTAPDATTDIRAALRGVPDMARALGRLSLGRGGPRDLSALRIGLSAAQRVAAALPSQLPAVLTEARDALSLLPALQHRLATALADPAPLRLEDGAIAMGFDGVLDAHRALRDDSRRVIATLQLDFAQRFGVASIKIKHHAQLGYIIEAPAVAVEKLRDHPDLTLRQGMANGARFTTPELSDLDRRITEAADLASAREKLVFATLVAEALAESEALARCAEALARIDVAQSAARLAEPGHWCRPVLTDDTAFAIKAGRHPVVEAAIAGQAAFVPNDCDLPPDARVLLLTGPNMAGKSTFLRQNALIVVLAQAGLPVPAASARLGVVDRLFSRVGAADDLARGRSTFMVEMTETASILHQAGPRSLVVVDEIGRGTATLDGLAIAWRRAAQPGTARHAGEGVPRRGGVPARSRTRGGRAQLGRARGAPRRRARPGGQTRRPIARRPGIPRRPANRRRRLAAVRDPHARTGAGFRPAARGDCGLGPRPNAPKRRIGRNLSTTGVVAVAIDRLTSRQCCPRPPCRAPPRPQPPCCTRRSTPCASMSQARHRAMRRLACFAAIWRASSTTCGSPSNRDT